MKKILLFLFITVFSFGQTLKGKYYFDGGSLNDTSGNNINLTQTGSLLSLTNDRFGNVNNAVTLNFDYLRRSSIPSTVFSISFWIKTTTNDTNKRIIIDQSSRTQGFDNQSQPGWYIYLKDGKVGIAGNFKMSPSNVNSGYHYTESTKVVTDGAWHHIAIIGGTSSYYDGSAGAYNYGDSYKIVVDAGLSINTNSERRYSSTQASASLTVAVPLTIGNNHTAYMNAQNVYLDTIDDINFYDGALTDTQISNLATAGGFCFAPQTNLLTVNNLTGNSVDITLSNATSGNYEYSFVEASQSPASGQITSITPGATVSLNGLQESTLYKFYLRKECSATYTSDWNALTFRTNGPIYVNASATGDNNGTSWTNAYTNLEDALATNPENEIWIKAGIYTPNTTNADPRKATFNLPNGVKIYGGFNGTETDKLQRNPNTNITILSGDLNGNDNTIITDTEATRQDNAYHVVSVRGNASNIIVDGVTISGGNANGGQLTTGAAASQYYDIRGGAIYVFPFNNGDAINVTFSNCKLEKNSGTNIGVYTHHTPSGVQNLSTNVNFEKCIVKDNYSAGLANFIYFGSNGYGINCTGRIENCLFYNNTSAQSSGIFIGTSTANGGNSNSVTLDIINSTFAKNIGNNGNVFTFANASATLVNFKNTIIYDNGTSAFTLSSGGYPKFSFSVGVPSAQASLNTNSNSNPLFTDANNYDFTLQSCSPAIDSGNNSYVTVSEDLLGNSRIFNTTVDRGAYEYGSSVLSNENFLNENTFVIYPNPVQNELNIQSNFGIRNVEIYSLDGKLVLQSIQNILNVQSLESGIYLMKIENNEGGISTKKFLKE